MESGTDGEQEPPGCNPGSAGTARAAIRAKRLLSFRFLRMNPGKRSPLSSQELLETDRLQRHKAKRDHGREKFLPPRAVRALAVWGDSRDPRRRHPTDRRETSAAPQRVPENATFLLMTHLPPRCIRTPERVSQPPPD